MSLDTRVGLFTPRSMSRLLVASSTHRPGSTRTGVCCRRRRARGSQLLEILLGNCSRQALGQHRHAIAPSLGQTLNDRTGQDVDQVLERVLQRGNSSGITVMVAPVALPMPRARCPALRPMATRSTSATWSWRRPSGLHQLHADVARGLVAERVDHGSRFEIVVDGLGTCTTRILPAARSETFIAENAVSSPMVMSWVTPSRCKESTTVPMSSSFWWDWRASAQDGPAREVDAAHVSNLQRADFLQPALHQAVKPVANAQHFHALQERANGSSADHAVDAGCGTASDQDC